jgi:hypothetical protein
MHLRSESGYTIVELMIAATLTLVIMGVAFSTFDNALKLNEAVTQLSDASQNLRAGTNLIVRDLLQAGRNLPNGISIPSGDDAEGMYRPSPTGEQYLFEGNTLQAITTGHELGPEISGRPTDLITIIMDDPFLEELEIYPSDADDDKPRLSADGSSLTAGDSIGWLQGDDDGIAPIKKGDLIYFLGFDGTTIQTVTDVDLEAGTISFAPDDPFNFNQPDAEAGSITQILPDDCGAPPPGETEKKCETMQIRRVLMYTYYVEEDSSGVPRLMRALNHFPAQALAGVIEDLTLRYDLVDGVTNPANIEDLPYTLNGELYTARQIRKVNLHVGVRSESVSTQTQDYVRHHLSTIVSLRNLAFVERYDTEG